MSVKITKIRRMEQVGCTSLDVAETFRRPHERVLRDIQELDCSDDFKFMNFEEITDRQNGTQPVIAMTAKGFQQLTYRYPGDSAEGLRKGFHAMFDAVKKDFYNQLAQREEAIAIMRVFDRSAQRFGTASDQLLKKYGIQKSTDLLEEEKAWDTQSTACLVAGLLNWGWNDSQIEAFIRENKPVRQNAG